MERNPTRDRALIGALIRREVEATMTWSKFAAKADLSRATVYRARDGDPRVTDQTYRRIERALGLPHDSLSSVGAHDFDVLIDLGVDRELVKWLEQVARKNSSAGTVPLILTTRGLRATEPVSDER